MKSIEEIKKTDFNQVEKKENLSIVLSYTSLFKRKYVFSEFFVILLSYQIFGRLQTLLKKTTILALSSLLVSSSLLSAPVHADKETQVKVKKETTSLAQETYTYTYEGVEFEHPTPLSDQELKAMYMMITNPEVYLETAGSLKPSLGKPVIGSYAVVLPPGGAQITSGPFYKTFSNIETRMIISALSYYVGSSLKIGATIANKLATRMVTEKRVDGTLAVISFFAGERIAPTHVGTWNYRAYDSSQGRYRTYSTLVHYRYGSYTSPISVQTQPLT